MINKTTVLSPQSSGSPLRTNDYGLKTPRGFTLIEIMVAVSIFAIVMMIGVGALLTMVSVNKRAQGVNSVMNNLNAAIEQMSRSIRVGSSYHCSTSISDLSNLTAPQDCAASGGVLLGFEPTNGTAANLNDQTVYRLNGTQLERSLASGANGTWVALTAPEVHITTFRFYVTGSQTLTGTGDTVQPRVIMIIKGTADLQGGPTEFNVQSSVTQRLIDL